MQQNQGAKMNPVISTIETKCKRCYSCIRQCPAKAIKVENGQAIVLAERCIACGNCIKVCPQHAKKVVSGIENTLEFLLSPKPTFAILAPSFPASFNHINPAQVISGLRKLGFDGVFEVAFGADLIVQKYNQLVRSGDMPIMITSPCSAIVSYVEKYLPQLVNYLAPIVSPMIATGRFIRQKVNSNCNIVFIGPCIAKKKEMQDDNVIGVISEVLTFQEIKSIFQNQDIDLSSLSESEFDRPWANLGAIFPVSGGLLKCSDQNSDIMNSDIVVSEGRDRVIEVLDRLNNQEIKARFLDILFCRGCINGPMMESDQSVFVRKEKIINYINERNTSERQKKAEEDFKKYSDLDVSRHFSPKSQTVQSPDEEDIQSVLRKTGKYKAEDELNCGACGYATCREKAIAVCQGLAEAEMCLPYMIDRFEQIQVKLENSNQDLKNSLQTIRETQQQLVQSEKMASVGRLAAGVAHELNNPLGGILLYGNLLFSEIKDNAGRESLKKVVDEAERCRKIVRRLLDFSHQTQLEKSPCDLEEILEKTLTLFQDLALFQNIKIMKRYGKLDKVNVDKLQLQQVLVNIILNAAEAMEGRGKLVLSTGRKKGKDAVYILIEDNGPGMSSDVIKKIFDPFFTTKPIGTGTGLGLAMAYGIVEKHGGYIDVTSEIGVGTTFTIVLPISKELIIK